MARKVRGKKQVLGKKVRTMDAQQETVKTADQPGLGLQGEGPVTKRFRCNTDHEQVREIAVADLPRMGGAPFCPRCGFRMDEHPSKAR